MLSARWDEINRVSLLRRPHQVEVASQWISKVVPAISHSYAIGIENCKTLDDTQWYNPVFPDYVGCYRGVRHEVEHSLSMQKVVNWRQHETMAWKVDILSSHLFTDA
jgi:hypothetical protein